VDNGKYIGNEIKYVTDVLNGSKVSYVERLEKAFAKRFGCKYAIAHNSGTSTLHTCLIAAGVGADNLARDYVDSWDEVISPAHTVIMPSFATLYQQAIPVYADIDPDTFNIDPKDIERKITPNTKAIIAVHMHGLPADMDAIMSIARKHNIYVIEDSAQCVLGEYKGRLTGSIGDMASFSFETKKHLSAGEGGIVVTNNEELATKIRKAAGLGYKTLTAGAALRQKLPDDFQDPNYKRHDTLGWNYRMNEVTAAVALAQLEYATSLVGRRRYVASYYLEAIKDCDWIIPQKTPNGVTNTYWTFTVRYEGEEAYNVTWKEFYNLYKKNGGDGFYGGVSVPYLEPVMSEYAFCRVAESIQPKMMQFKTNYRSLEIGKVKARVLKKTINEIEGK